MHSSVRLSPFLIVISHGCELQSLGRLRNKRYTEDGSSTNGAGSDIVEDLLVMDENQNQDVNSEALILSSLDKVS